jgi:WD40 repeat protein
MFVLRGHEKPVYDIAFSPDGARLASIGMDSFNLWDLHARQPLWRKHHECFGAHLGFSPDGDRLLVSDHGIGIFSAEDGDKRDVLEGSRESSFFAISPVGTHIAVGVAKLPLFESPSIGIHCYQIGNSKDYRSYAIPDDNFGPCAFGPDGRELATLGKRRLSIWDHDTGTERGQVDVHDEPRAITWSPDGCVLASASGKYITLRESDTLNSFATLRQVKGYFLDLAFDPTGRFLATAAKDGFVRLWDVASWTELRSYGWRIGGLRCLAFSPDGTRCACAGEKGKIVVWDVDD